MKTTIDIPEELYRRVKIRIAMEGRPFRSVAVELLQNWLEDPPSARVSRTPPGLTQAELEAAPWLAITRPHVKPGMSHDMDAIRGAIAKGWGADVAEKLSLSKTKR